MFVFFINYYILTKILELKQTKKYNQLKVKKEKLSCENSNCLLIKQFYSKFKAFNNVWINFVNN